jgi:hypothetical protein
MTKTGNTQNQTNSIPNCCCVELQNCKQPVDLAGQEISQLHHTIADLHSTIEAKDLALLKQQFEFEESIRRLEKDFRRKEYKHQHLCSNMPADVTPELPQKVLSLTEAAAFCQQYLSQWLSLPDSALRDLALLDAAPEVAAWAAMSWRGLRALAAYASEAATTRGDFWTWCSTSDHRDKWSASTKKLAMTDGCGVLNGRKLRSTRMLPVDTAVHPSGRIEMLAHLKIAAGGGNNIPRIHFYDDTKGATGKIHVGFFGPHYLVPNSKS